MIHLSIDSTLRTDSISDGKLSSNRKCGPSKHTTFNLTLFKTTEAFTIFKTNIEEITLCLAIFVTWALNFQHNPSRPFSLLYVHFVISHVKVRILDLKINFKKKYAQDLLCPFCRHDQTTFEHVFSCNVGLWRDNSLKGMSLTSLSNEAFIQFLRSIAQFLIKCLKYRSEMLYGNRFYVEDGI